MKSLKSLNLNGTKVNELKWISCLKEMESLYLSSKQIESIELSRTLLKIRRLNIKTEFVRDLSPISEMSMIERLSLSVRVSPMVGFLKNLTNLKQLELYDVENEDLEPLQYLKHLIYSRLKIAEQDIQSGKP